MLGTIDAFQEKWKKFFSELEDGALEWQEGQPLAKQEEILERIDELFNLDGYEKAIDFSTDYSDLEFSDFDETYLPDGYRFDNYMHLPELHINSDICLLTLDNDYKDIETALEEAGIIETLDSGIPTIIEQKSETDDPKYYIFYTNLNGQAALKELTEDDVRNLNEDIFNTFDDIDPTQFTGGEKFILEARGEQEASRTLAATFITQCGIEIDQYSSVNITSYLESLRDFATHPEFEMVKQRDSELMERRAVEPAKIKDYFSPFQIKAMTERDSVLSDILYHGNEDVLNGIVKLAAMDDAVKGKLEVVLTRINKSIELDPSQGLLKSRIGALLRAIEDEQPNEAINLQKRANVIFSTMGKERQELPSPQSFDLSHKSKFRSM